MAYTAIGLRGKKGLSLSRQSSEQITQRSTQYENNSYKANFLIRDRRAVFQIVTWRGYQAQFLSIAPVHPDWFKRLLPVV